MTTNTASYVIRSFVIEAGGFVQVSTPGDFVTCLSASDMFKLSFDSGPKNDFETGLSVRPYVAFRNITVHNPKTASITVRLGIGRGEFVDSRFIPAQALQVEVNSPDIFQTGATVSIAPGATQVIAPADTARVEIAARNLSTSDRLWLQDGAQAGAQGWPLDAKEGVLLTTTDALSVHNPNATAIDVATFQIRRGA